MDRVFLLVRKDNWFPLGVFSALETLKEALPYMPVRDDEELLIQEFLVDPEPAAKANIEAETTFHDIKSEVVRGPG
jgi:hypothetical protein